MALEVRALYRARVSYSLMYATTPTRETIELSVAVRADDYVEERAMAAAKQWAEEMFENKAQGFVVESIAAAGRVCVW
jgi:hypothetical protein